MSVTRTRTRIDPADGSIVDEQLVGKVWQTVATRDTRKVITGSRGANAALASLLTALEQLGIIKDDTT